MILTVATYNVHEWVGTDRRRIPDRVIRVIRELGADVVALQEVALPIKDSTPYALAYIAEKTGMHGVAGPTFVKKDHDYGNLLLSRHPLEGIQKIDLSVDAREPRGAIIGTLTIDGVLLKIIATHLGLRIGERRQQWRRLIERIDPHTEERVVLMGDFNEWNPMGRTIRWMRSFFAPVASPRTYPSWYPAFSLDRILVYPKSLHATVKIHRSGPAKTASDHLPLIGRIEV